LLYSHGAHHKENTSSIIVSSLIAGETMCPQSCSLAMALVLLPVYTAVTWTWIYTSIWSCLIIRMQGKNHIIKMTNEIFENVAPSSNILELTNTNKLKAD
jgi:hypothetical protein